MSEQVLDPCCGSKMFWFDKDNPDVLFCDIRDEKHVLCDGRRLEIKPDIQIDFRNMPFADDSFYLVIFDPPHLIQAGDKSWLAKKYGKLGEDWKEDLAAGFDECWRVLRPGGTLIFKWSAVQIKVKDILACFSQKPLVGQKKPRNHKTHWMVFYKGV